MASENVQMDIEETAAHVNSVTPEQSIVSPEFLDSFYNNNNNNINGGYQHQTYYSNYTPHYPENRRSTAATSLDFNRTINNNLATTTNTTHRPSYEFLQNFYWEHIEHVTKCKAYKLQKIGEKKQISEDDPSVYHDKDFLTAYTGGHSLFLVSFFPRQN